MFGFQFRVPTDLTGSVRLGVGVSKLSARQFQLMPISSPKRNLPPTGLSTAPLEETLTPNAPVVKTVSVILVTRNQAAELRRALTALEQSINREQLEVHVVDCGSHDEVRDVAAEFPDAQVLYMPDDFGATKALNMAVRSAKADLLFFLSPDVEVAADTIARLKERLESLSDTAAVCPLLITADGAPAPLMQPLPTKETLQKICAGEAGPVQAVDLTQESVAAGYPVGYPGRYALLVRKQFIIGMNYFDARFGEYWADADLAMQIRRAHRKIRVFPGICVKYSEPAKKTESTEHVSDRYVGAAHLLSKHEGFMAGLTFRMSAILGALVRFKFDLLGALVSGTKLGSHAN